MRWTGRPTTKRWLARAVLASAVCGGAACGGATPPPARPAPIAAAPSTAAPPAGPSERECDELITHAVALGIDEQAAHGGEPATTEADHEAVRRQLHEEVMNGCRALPREAFRCAVEAASLSALAACGASDQRSPSSSTSNSSVAPGGITPPAPRSP
ncbi:MAG TPA: hypothetical protein VFP84_21930 [Kofleriaceae bacterium]|nr:hypothetical protein [Kofleriaceae bacterium]